jgi:hypothetical protein
MSNQLEYLVVKTHIDELVRSAERARMVGGRDSRSSRHGWRGLTAGLRRQSGRGKGINGPELNAECP